MKNKALPKDGVARYRPERGIMRAAIIKNGGCVALFVKEPAVTDGERMAAAVSEHPQPETVLMAFDEFSRIWFECNQFIFDRMPPSSRKILYTAPVSARGFNETD